MKTFFLKCAVVAGCVGLIAGNSSANTYTFDTSSGDSAQAIFVTGAGQLQITLQNLQSNPQSAADCLSALAFSLSGGSLSAGSTMALGSGSGLERTINGDGTFSDGSVAAAGWVLSGVPSSALLDVLSGSGHAGPAHTIIGAPDSATHIYDNADGSITGNPPHNPFLYGDVTFVLNIADMTSSSTVSDVFFQFGTKDGAGQVPSIPKLTPRVPDGGATVTLLGSALVGIHLLRRKLSKC